MYIIITITSTETIRRIRDEDPRTATSTFTQLLSSGPYAVDGDVKTPK